MISLERTSNLDGKILTLERSWRLLVVKTGSMIVFELWFMAL